MVEVQYKMTMYRMVGRDEDREGGVERGESECVRVMKVQ